MSVAEAMQLQGQPEPAGFGRDHALMACRYLVRCRRAGDRRHMRVLLEEAFSPGDSTRLLEAIRHELGAARFAALAHFPLRQP